MLRRFRWLYCFLASWSLVLPVLAQEAAQSFWQMGEPDGSAIEFAPGSQVSVEFKVGMDDPSLKFPGLHDGTITWIKELDGEKPYHLDFDLDELPQEELCLELHLRFLNAAPTQLQVTLNGHKGVFPLLTKATQPVDSNDGNMILLASTELAIPLPAKWFLLEGNRISLTPLGFGSLHYDSLALKTLASSSAEPVRTPQLVPSMFYVGNQTALQEKCQLLVPFHMKFNHGRATIKIGDQELEIDTLSSGDYDFGILSQVVLIDAMDGPQEAQIAVDLDGEKTNAKHEIVPSRRWKLFFCPKVHNDVGYTDIQPHVNELDTRNTDTILSILHNFPFYKFNFETSWLVENYLDCRTPEVGEELLEKSREGRAAFNAFYLNLLTGVCSGEELYRALYFTHRLHREEGTDFQYACLTDAPSHTWFLPTLLRDVGINAFANGSNQGRAPILVLSDLNDQSPYYWEGINGEKILMFYARTYAQWKMLTCSGFIGPTASYDYLKNSLPQFLLRYARKDYAPDAVMAYGAYIDNAAIPETGEAEFIARWNEEFAYPQIIVATDAEYFQYIEKNFADKLPTYRGDAGAYWEDGVASTAEATNWNRHTKQILPLAETSCSLATLFEPRFRYPAEQFHATWKNVLFYDEHTWGAFNSISQPHREGVRSQWEIKESYSQRANLDARNLLARSLNRLCEQFNLDDSTILVFNWQNSSRSQILETELSDLTELVDLETNEPVPVEVVHQAKDWSRVQFLAKDVPPMGYRGFGIRLQSTAEAPQESASAAQANPPAQSVDEGDWAIENDHYRLELDAQTGAITSLIDKAAGRELVDGSADYLLNEYLYVTGGGDETLMPNLAVGKPAAELDVHHPEAAKLITKSESPLGSRIIVETSAAHTPTIRSEYFLPAYTKRLDILNTVVKESILEKEAVYFAFPFAAEQPAFEYQIQNGWVTPNRDQLPGACKEWFAPQNVTHLQDRDFSIAWASPDAPLMTLVDINRGLWLKNLSISNGHLFSYAMNNYWWTNYRAEQGGEIKFRYFLTSGKGMNRSELASFDIATRSPVFAYPKLSSFSASVSQQGRPLPAASGSFLDLPDPNLQIVVLKQAEDGAGWILRLQEIAGQSGTAQLELPMFDISSAHLCNGVEVIQTELEVEGDSVAIPYQANRYITFRLDLQLKN